MFTEKFKSMTSRQVTGEQNEEKFDQYGPFTYQNVAVTLFSSLKILTTNIYN